MTSHWLYLMILIRWTISPMSTEESPITLQAEEVMEIHHDIKLPHGTQTPYKMINKPDSTPDWLRICRLEYNSYDFVSCQNWKLCKSMNICRIRLAHVGKNYPCVKDPTYGYKSSQNSSTIKYNSRNRTWGISAFIDFDMISNWGKESR